MKQQAEKIKDEIIVTAQEVLPVAKVVKDGETVLGVSHVMPATATNSLELINKTVSGTVSPIVPVSGTSTEKK